MKTSIIIYHRLKKQLARANLTPKQYKEIIKIIADCLNRYEIQQTRRPERVQHDKRKAGSIGTRPR